MNTLSTQVLDKAAGHHAFYVARSFWPSGQFSEVINSLTLTVSARLVGRVSISAGPCIVVKAMF